MLLAKKATAAEHKGMKTLLSLLTASLLLPSLAFAATDGGASTPKDKALDAAIIGVDTTFDAAQKLVNDSPFDEGTQASVSNVLKTRHDTVKNSINNVR